MPNSYSKSKGADQDIKQITKGSMADFGELQTNKYMEGLGATLQRLADKPDRGRPFIHSATQRTYLYHRYVSHIVYYRQKKQAIFIVRIPHIKMLPEKHL